MFVTSALDGRDHFFPETFAFGAKPIVRVCFNFCKIGLTFGYNARRAPYVINQCIGVAKGPRASCPSKCLAYLVILGFEN